MTELIQDNDTVDNAVDLEIQSCLTLEHLRSFFLFAGAGSGKTRSLVNAINYLRSKDDPGRTNRNWLQVRGKQVAVITFTNAARDEIIERTERDPLVLVCTIHSFAWSLIEDFQEDIRDWLRGDLEFSIAEMVAAQGKRTRKNTKVYADTERSIQSKTRRLARLDEVQVFNYSPSGESSGRDSLNHSEVLKIVSNFLENHQTMRQVLVDRFPVLLVDESQDTNRHLMDALFTVAKANEGNFCLGLLGDMMQRIYADGKVGLGAEGSIPTTWAQPSKKMNHRSGKRIVQLINQIRSADDKQTQTPRTDRPDSIVRLFVVDRKSSDTRAMEQMVAKAMSHAAADAAWTDPQSVKSLILEHHMAAARLGFSEFFDPLYKVTGASFRTGLLDGSLPGANFFCELVPELIEAIRSEDEFAIARIVQDRSPLLTDQRLHSAGDSQVDLLAKASDGVACLRWYLEGNSDPKLENILQIVASRELLEVPRVFEPFVSALAEETLLDDIEEDADQETELAAWRSAINVPLSQVSAYFEYVSGDSPYDTHQGVKGLQFPRVMVIINGAEARGFLFDYDKLFGATPNSDKDIENKLAGLDHSEARTRRLLYVTASRAKESLAVVAYTDNPKAIIRTVTEAGLFSSGEVMQLVKGKFISLA